MKDIYLFLMGLSFSVGLLSGVWWGNKIGESGGYRKGYQASQQETEKFLKACQPIMTKFCPPGQKDCPDRRALLCVEK